jgi:ATP-dependent DNA ligase
MVSGNELTAVHLRLHQLYANFQKGNPGQENEQLVNAHIFVVGEMKKRDFNHANEAPIDLASQKIAKLAEYAPVISDKPPQEIPKITWDSIREYFKSSFLISKNAISLVGGVACNEAGGNDIDILIKIPSEEQLFNIIAFRIFRMLPPELRNRIHISKSKGDGPFTDHYNLGDLQMTIIPEPVVVKMQEPQSAEKEKTSAEADESAKDGSIVPGRFFKPMKPTKAHVEGQRQTLDEFVDLFEGEDFPIYSSIKRDGVHGVIHKLKDKVWIFTEDGSDITDKLPSLVAAARQLKYDSIVLDCELELWPQQGSERIHWPREEMSSRLLLKESDDKDIFAQCFAILYLNGKDVHTENYEDIYKIMEQVADDKGGIKFGSDYAPTLKIQLIRHIVDANKKGLESTTQQLSKIPFSEGNVAKMSKSVYNLIGKRSGWVKFRTNSTLIAIVIDVVETSTTGIANLEIGISKDDVLISLGKTFNVKTRDFKKGQLVVVEYETFIHTVEEREKSSNSLQVESFSVWAPRVLLEDVSRGSKVSSIKEVIASSIRDRVYQRKELKNEGKFFDII